MLWDDQPNAIPVDQLIVDTLGAYEAVLLGKGMALRRDPAWGGWQNRLFALSSREYPYFNIWVEEVVFFGASGDFDVRKIRKTWNQLLSGVREETKKELPPTELEAPPSLTRITLGKLKQEPGFLGQVVRGISRSDLSGLFVWSG